MVQIKKMKENQLELLLRELTVRGGTIKELQEEKQSVMNEFDRQYKRYKRGDVSHKAFSQTLRKIAAEISDLDTKIRTNIRSSEGLSKRTGTFMRAQKPEKVRATERGMLKGGKKKRATKRKVARKAAPRKKARPKARQKVARKKARPKARKAAPKRKAHRTPARRKAARRPARRVARARKKR